MRLSILIAIYLAFGLVGLIVLFPGGGDLLSGLSVIFKELIYGPSSLPSLVRGISAYAAAVTTLLILAALAVWFILGLITNLFRARAVPTYPAIGAVIVIVSVILLGFSAGFDRDFTVGASLMAIAWIFAFLVSQHQEPEEEPPADEDEPNEVLPEPDQDDVHARSFSWYFNFEPHRPAARARVRQFNFDWCVPKQNYDELVARDHGVRSHADYVEFANQGLEDQDLKRLAMHLRVLGEHAELDQLGMIHFIMSFALSFDYEHDDVNHTQEYPKFPLEMLVDGCGDCEDFSILAGAICSMLGEHVELLLIEYHDQTAGHASLGVEYIGLLRGEALHSSRTGKRLLHAEVTPNSSETTKDGTSVQWWLGMEMMGNIKSIDCWPIKRSESGLPQQGER